MKGGFKWFSSCVLISGILLTSCKPNGEIFVQQVEPSESVDLPYILKQIPAIKSLADPLSLEALDDLAQGKKAPTSEEVTKEIQSYMRLAELTRGPLPEMIGAASGSINSAFRHFLFKPESFSALKDVSDYLLSQESQPLSNIVKSLAEMLHFKINNSSFYPSAVMTSLPAENAWQNCDPLSSAYAEGRDRVLYHNQTEAKRKELINQFGQLRLIFCALDGESGEIGENIGLYVYKYLQTSKIDIPDAETPARDELKRIQNNFADIQDDEKKIREWFATDANKTAFLDILLRDGVELLNNDTIFSGLKEVKQAITW